ncbi:MAG TPA: STAS domain-containing protein [Solirubrobacteraceae bacterium]|jgi:anti-sigma B factor antagonist
MVRATQFEIECDFQEQTGRLAASGELDMVSAPVLEKQALELLERGASELIIDLRGLTFVDSSGLRLFIALNQRATADDWKLALIRPPEPALTVFRITRAEENLPFVDHPRTP